MPMQLSRRHFLWLTSAAASLPVSRVAAQRARGADSAAALPPSIASLPSMKDQARPITR